MQVLREFKTFIAKGNVIDLSVGVIIGAGFGKIVESMVKDVITPILGLMGGQPDFSRIVIGAHQSIKDGKEVFEGGIMIGNFLNAVIGFVILAAVVFFILVKPMNRLTPPKPKVAAATLDDVVAALRDLKK